MTYWKYSDLEYSREKMEKGKKLKSEHYDGRTIQFFKTDEGVKAYVRDWLVARAPTKTEALELAEEVIRRKGHFKGEYAKFGFG